MDFRPIQETDFTAFIKVFDSNTPKYFASFERANFTAHLQEATHYFVLEQAGQIVAYGGLEEIKSQIWVLCWGIVRQDLHRQKLGKPYLCTA
jgi:hypothetical protein